MMIVIIMITVSIIVSIIIISIIILRALPPARARPIFGLSVCARRLHTDHLVDALTRASAK